MRKASKSLTKNALKEAGFSDETIEIIRHGKFGIPQKPFRFDAELLIPFAPRWLGIRHPLDRKNNIRNMEGFYFELGWQKAIWQYFPVPQEGSFLYNLAVHWDWFVEHPPKSPTPVAEQLLNAQPAMEPSSKSRSVPHAKMLAKPPRRRCIHEPMGWYEPAHFGRKGDYGIHLSQGGLVHAAAEVHSLCPDEPRNVVLVAVCHFAYCHQLMHAWIEDICSLLDFHCGVSGDPAERPYSLAYRKWGGLILLEESVCDMAAFGLLAAFLESPAVAVRKSREIARFNPKKVMSAMAAWIENRSDHRISFVPIKRERHQNEVYKACFERLVTSVYGYKATHDAIDNFLGISWPTEPARGMQHSKTDRNDTALNSSDVYPVTIHLE